MGNSVFLLPPGKILCAITNELRDDTPEENVRQRGARSLMSDYRYRKQDIAIDFRLQVKSTKKRADLVVFKQDSKHLQENIIAIIEAKREDINSIDKTRGESRLKSYMEAT